MSKTNNAYVPASFITNSLDGLEKFFEPQLQDGGLTFKQAVHYYGLPPAELRSKLKAGELPAVRIDTESGKKWRVYPDGVPGHMQSISTDETESTQKKDEKAAPLDPTERESVLVLKEHIADLEHRLEAAAYRNGYLEMQVDSLKQHVNLLTKDRDTSESFFVKARRFLKLA
jgi:hypothetical protein